jgi:putative NIF3 family GTP cyclohydrolase 1 type 2
LSPAVTFDDLCGKCKTALRLEHLRVVGAPDMTCRRVGLFAGWGGAMGGPQIELLSQEGADVVICGETVEWTTCEYTRDAVTAGIAKGFIVLGHAGSEEPGMADVVEWLRPKLPGVPMTHVPAGDPFRFL